MTRKGRSLHKIDGMRLRASHPVASPQGMETYLRETFPTAALARLEVDNHRAVLTVVYENPTS